MELQNAIMLFSFQVLQLSLPRAEMASAGLHGQLPGAARVRDRGLCRALHSLSSLSPRGDRRQCKPEGVLQLLLGPEQAGRLTVNRLVNVILGVEPKVQVPTSWGRSPRSKLMTISVTLSTVRANVTGGKIPTVIHHNLLVTLTSRVSDIHRPEFDHFKGRRIRPKPVPEDGDELVEASPHEAPPEAGAYIANDGEVRHVVVKLKAAEPPTQWPWENERNQNWKEVT